MNLKEREELKSLVNSIEDPILKELAEQMLKENQDLREHQEELRKKYKEEKELMS